MIKRMFLLCFALGLFAGLHAQGNPQGHNKVLNAQELGRQPWFYNLDSALVNPEKVYKLSLDGQKIKSLPAEIGQLVNLQVLNLSDNKLKTLPVELGDLKNQHILSIYNNKLRWLPSELTNLENLQVLYLGRNRLTGLPVWITKFRSLRRLDISINPITPLEMQYIRNMLPRTDITF